MNILLVQGLYAHETVVHSGTYMLVAWGLCIPQEGCQVNLCDDVRALLGVAFLRDLMTCDEGISLAHGA